MAQQLYLWEGDLVTGFDYADLWAYEEYGNSDALGEIVAVGPVIGSDDADRAQVFDALERVVVERFRQGADQALLDDSVEQTMVRPRELAEQLLLPDVLEIRFERPKEFADLLLLPDSIDIQIIRQREEADRLGDLPDLLERARVLGQIDLADGIYVLDSVDPPGSGLDRIEVWILRQQAEIETALVIPDTVEEFLEQITPPVTAPSVPPSGFGVVRGIGKRRRQALEDEIMDLIMAGVI